MSLTYGEMFAGYGGLGMGVQMVLGGEMSLGEQDGLGSDPETASEHSIRAKRKGGC